VRFVVEFRPHAFADVAEAFSWYEGQRAGLGPEFEADLEHAVDLLTRTAAAGPMVHRGVRRVLLRRFPFALYYELAAEKVKIRGVIHTKRHPSTWKRRS